MVVKSQQPGGLGHPNGLSVEAQLPSSQLMHSLCNQPQQPCSQYLVSVRQLSLDTQDVGPHTDAIASADVITPALLPVMRPSLSSGNCSTCSSDSQRCDSGSTTPSSDASSAGVVITVLDPSEGLTPGSIYDLYTQRRVYSIMMVVALAALMAPLSNTIFLPAMKAIQLDLHTTAAAVTSSVATFQVALGLAALVWGPASDTWGRKPALLAATALFALTNVPLILAPNIAVLLVFRTLQGAAIAAYASAATGMVSDICSPANRGTLFGVCSVAALLGPVIGPPLGGGLSQAFGWRSMFVLLATISALVILPLLLWCVPETLQYKVMQSLAKQQPDKAKKIAEAQDILGQGVPKFKAPWQAVRILMDRQLVLHVFVILLGYSLYIITLAVLPFYLAKPPYSLSTDSIGAAYLPGALAAIVASPCGGRLADLSARPNPRQPLRRLVYANVLMLLLMPVSLVVWGWGLQAGLHLAIPLAACFMASFVNSLYMPGLFTVVTIVKQHASAAAVGGVYALLFLLSGLGLVLGSTVITHVGLGPFLSILAALHFACTLAAFIHIIRSCSATQLPQHLISRQGSAAFVRSAHSILATGFKENPQQIEGGGAGVVTTEAGEEKPTATDLGRGSGGGGSGSSNSQHTRVWCCCKDTAAAAAGITCACCQGATSGCNQGRHGARAHHSKQSLLVHACRER